MKFRSCHIAWILSVMAAAFTGCSLVDEDLTDCEADHKINYELRLVTNLTTELQTQLSTQVELTAVATAIQDHLKGVFTDYAHDVDLSFYDVKEDMVRLHHETHIMDANQSSYTLFIPVRKYMHVAVANLHPTLPDGTPAPKEFELADDEKCHSSRLDLVVNSTENIVPSQTSGVFSARLPMDIKDGVDQQFDVKLYMVNSASALVLDTLGSHIKDIRVFASGFANGFDLADSTYRFTFNPKVRANEVEVDDGRFNCFCAVTLPSMDTDGTKSIINTDDPYVAQPAEESLWQYMVYITCADGSVTETILGVKMPLRASQFKLIRAKIQSDGSVVPREPFVGASVTLNWNDGPSWEIDV